MSEPEPPRDFWLSSGLDWTKAIVLGVIAVVVIAGAAALVSATVDQSARDAYQAHDGSVRLSDR